jgi:hypothetical protein
MTAATPPMDSPALDAAHRPLARSLEPLEEESVAGYLLRLSYRLRIAPLHLARLTGCTNEASPNIRRRLLLDLDVDRFARATRLTTDEAAELTLTPWADRYPPIARSLFGSGWPVAFDDWLLNHSLRYCPDCLAGDGSSLQQQYGGPWKKAWHLPVVFICPQHRRFLLEECPKRHPPDPGIWRLIAFTSGSGLHPAQCRQSEQPGKGVGRHRRSCGTRLDQPGQANLLQPSNSMIETQQRLLDLLATERTANDAVQAFTDLRVITALLHASWPLGRDLIDPAFTSAVTEHIHQLSTDSGRGRPALDMPPKNVLATAAVLTAATDLLRNPDLPNILALHLQASWSGPSSKAPWAGVLERHQAACSPALLQAAEPSIRAYRRLGGPHGAKAPARSGGYRPEHIPAFLETVWYQQHLAPLECRSSTSLRRTAAVLLVQWVTGGPKREAANFLGINPSGNHHTPSQGFAQWLKEHSADRFIAALQDLALHLDATAVLIDYHHRRQALQNWSLDLDTWHEIINRLPPVPGPIQPRLDDRKRQEASAIVWAHITQGEPRYAPRPIEAEQPEHIRREWHRHRGPTWSKFTHPNPMKHYAAFHQLLLDHADVLARKIDRDHR